MCTFQQFYINPEICKFQHPRAMKQMSKLNVEIEV